MIHKLRSITDVLKYYKGRKSFDRVLNQLKIVSVGDGKCTAELEIYEEHINSLGLLHSGLATTLVDCISGYALMTKIPGAHVSVDIHVSFLKKIRIGSNVLLEGYVNNFGKTMAFLELQIHDKETKEVLVKGTHLKYFVEYKN